jgi:hypothetical protein
VEYAELIDRQLSNFNRSIPEKMIYHGSFFAAEVSVPASRVSVTGDARAISTDLQGNLSQIWSTTMG